MHFYKTVIYLFYDPEVVFMDHMRANRFCEAILISFKQLQALHGIFELHDPFVDMLGKHWRDEWLHTYFAYDLHTELFLHH